MTAWDATAAQALADAVAAAVGGAIGSRLEGVPGVSRPHVHATSGGPAVRVAVTLNGWSPTLHRKWISIDERLRTLDGEGAHRTSEEIAGDLRPLVDDLVDRQAERSLQARRLGATTPLPTAEIGHVQVEEDLAALLDVDAATARAKVLDAVRRAHADTVPYKGGAALRAGGVLIGEGRGEDGAWIRCALLTVKLRAADGRRIGKMHEFDVDVVCDPLPATALAGLVGRRVGEVVALHPALDGRTIRRIANRTGRPGITIGIDAHLEPLDAVLA